MLTLARLCTSTSFISLNRIFVVLVVNLLFLLFFTTVSFFDLNYEL